MSNRKIEILLAELPPLHKKYSPKQQNDIVIGFLHVHPFPPILITKPPRCTDYNFFFRSYFILPCFLLSERIRRKETRNLHTYNFR